MNNKDLTIYISLTPSQIDVILNALDEKSISINELYHNIYDITKEQIMPVNGEEREEKQNMENKKIICKDCGKEFEFTVGEQKFFEEKGFASPVRCKECRTAKKARNEEKNDNFEDMLQKFKDNTVNFE